MSPLILDDWITRRIVALRNRGATIRIYDRNPEDAVPVSSDVSSTQYAPWLSQTPGSLITSLPVYVPDTARSYWIVAFPPYNPSGITPRSIYTREDGQTVASDPTINLYNVQDWGFLFDPAEPAKQWAGFEVRPDGGFTAIMPQKKSHIDEKTTWAALAFAGAVAAGELLGAAAATETAAPAAAAQETATQAAAAPPGASPGISAGEVAKGAAAVVKGATTVAGAVTQVAGALRNGVTTGADGNPQPKPPAPDNTIYWVAGAAIVTIGVLL